jgi:hypothetical protein
MTDNAQIPNEAVPANNAAQPVIAEAPQAVEPAVATAPVVPTDNTRTQQQFEKLLESNKGLYEANQLLRQELQQRREANQQFAPVQLPPIQQQPIPQGVNPADFIETDPASGERYINDVKLQSRIAELNDRASRAEEAVQRYVETSEQREIERQNREAFSAYPDLNPADPKHDVVFHNQTRAVIYDSVLNPQDYGGKPLSFKDAADYVRGQQSRLAEASQKPQQNATTEKDTQEQQQAAQELKQQATASPTGEIQTQRNVAQDVQELKRLQMATRLGDPDALAIRLANVEHIKKSEEEAS